jgi:hypothetical protein
MMKEKRKEKKKGRLEKRKCNEKKRGKIRGKGNRLVILEIVVHKLYCPYYYWVIKIECGNYIN